LRPEPAIESLRAQIERIEGRNRRAKSVLPFGITEVDSRLPGGGLAFGALHEIAGGGNGAIDSAAAALFTAGVAASTKGKVLWCITRPDLFAPVIAQAGLAADRVIYVEAGDDNATPSLSPCATTFRSRTMNLAIDLMTAEGMLEVVNDTDSALILINNTAASFDLSPDA
jgi:hypothetical protein